MSCWAQGDRLRWGSREIENAGPGGEGAWTVDTTGKRRLQVGGASEWGFYARPHERKGGGGSLPSANREGTKRGPKEKQNSMQNAKGGGG